MWHNFVRKGKLGKCKESEVEFKWKPKRKYSKHSFTPKTFHCGDLFPIATAIISTTIRLLMVNDGQDLMSIKFRSFFKYKLHPTDTLPSSDPALLLISFIDPAKNNFQLPCPYFPHLPSSQTTLNLLSAKQTEERHPCFLASVQAWLRGGGGYRDIATGNYSLLGQ